MNMLSSYRKTVDDKLAALHVVENYRDKTVRDIEKHQQILTTRQEAHAYIQTAAEITQKSLEKQLSDVVSPALAAVFVDKDPYEFRADFVQRRNTTECDLFFDRNGERVDPLSDAGLGPADITSVALKVSNRASSQTRDLLIIDEPCKNLSKSYHIPATIMFRELSKRLGLQLIMVTHVPDFREGANRLITVKMKKEVSYVEQKDQ